MKHINSSLGCWIDIFIYHYFKHFFSWIIQTVKILFHHTCLIYLQCLRRSRYYDFVLSSHSPQVGGVPSQTAVFLSARISQVTEYVVVLKWNPVWQVYVNTAPTDKDASLGETSPLTIDGRDEHLMISKEQVSEQWFSQVFNKNEECSADVYTAQFHVNSL